MKFIGTFFDLCKRLIKNGGMESVTSLPTTDNFEGREVNYKGTKYIYYNGDWVNQRDAEKLGGVDESIFIRSSEVRSTADDAKIILIGNTFTHNRNYISPLYNPLMRATPNDFTIEYSDDGEVFTEIEKTDPIYNVRHYKSSSGNVLKFSNHSYYRFTFPFKNNLFAGTFFSMVFIGNQFTILSAKVESLKDVWETTFQVQNSEITQQIAIVEFITKFLSSTNFDYNCKSVRITIKGSELGSSTSYGVSGIAFLKGSDSLAAIDNYFEKLNDKISSPFSLESQETINYDVNNIKPTQTGEVKKSSSWVWQYLVQSVNWLRDNMALKTHTHNGTDSQQIDYSDLSNLPVIDTEVSATSTNAVQNKAIYNAINGKADKAILAWHNTNGCLVKTDIPINTSMFVYVHIYGNSYQARSPINTELVFYSYTGTSIIGYSAIHYGYNFGDIHAFVYEDKLCLWFKQTSQFQTFYVEAFSNAPYITNVKGSSNRVTSITNEQKPIEGISREVIITPKKVVYNDHTHNGTNSEKIDYNNLENKPTIYTSATINGTSVDFSAQNNNIPAYISYNNVLYPFRFTGSAFQIYRNEVWADLVNFDNFISNDRGIITESNMEDWYRPGINEYFIDESAAVNFLTLKKPLAPPEKWTNITINTGTLTNKITGLKSTVLLDNIRTNIKNVFGEEPYTLYTEYDISAMLDSGFGYKLVLKLEKGTAESNSVIVECYKVW